MIRPVMWCAMSIVTMAAQHAFHQPFPTAFLVLTWGAAVLFLLDDIATGRRK